MLADAHVTRVLYKCMWNQYIESVTYSTRQQHNHTGYLHAGILTTCIYMPKHTIGQSMGQSAHIRMA